MNVSSTHHFSNLRSHSKFQRSPTTATRVLQYTGIFSSNPTYYHHVFKLVHLPWLPKCSVENFEDDHYIFAMSDTTPEMWSLISSLIWNTFVLIYHIKAEILTFRKKSQLTYLHYTYPRGLIKKYRDWRCEN